MGARFPILCGAMYPCSNPELVAAASAAGALGVVQPVSLTYVHGHDFRDGLRTIREITDRPFGMNVLLERSSASHRTRLECWVEIALEEGVRTFVTAQGDPAWVVRAIEASGGHVLHDVMTSREAARAKDAGVTGFIAVNDSGGGHVGRLPAEVMIDLLAPLGLDVVCAGGVGSPVAFRRALQLGYAGIQMGTRFIATHECSAGAEYKEAIVAATGRDVTVTERLTGRRVSVLRNEYQRHLGERVEPLLKLMLRSRRLRPWARRYYKMTALRGLESQADRPRGAREYWQAGRSVDGITEIRSVGEVIREFAAVVEGGPPSA